MTEPGDRSLRDETPEADVAEQAIPVDAGEQDTWQDAARVTTARDWDANEADLIEQAIAVPDEDSGFDR